MGRSAPEIDIFEATTQGTQGGVSQSGQWAPFNAGYEWFNTTKNMIITDPTVTQQNTYTGGFVFFFFVQGMADDRVSFTRLAFSNKPYLRFL